ncbi:hypothetical protein AAVH_15709 [Aphelenchoides avenae]|nr:hypothetical protein AAVH_15709 [Aphelenchus avenae]
MPPKKEKEQPAAGASEPTTTAKPKKTKKKKQRQPTEPAQAPAGGSKSASERREAEEMRVARHWDGKPLVCVKKLGKGAGAHVYEVRLAGSAADAPSFALREEFIDPAPGQDELTDADLLAVVKHLKNHRKCHG